MSSINIRPRPLLPPDAPFGQNFYQNFPLLCGRHAKHSPFLTLALLALLAVGLAEKGNKDHGWSEDAFARQSATYKTPNGLTCWSGYDQKMMVVTPLGDLPARYMPNGKLDINWDNYDPSRQVRAQLSKWFYFSKALFLG